MDEIEAVLRDVETWGVEDRERARAMLAAVLSLHKTGIARLLDCLRRRGGPLAVEEAAADEAVAALMLLHDLHPVDVETRMREALATLEGELRRMNAAATFTGSKDGKLGVRVTGSGGAANRAVSVVKDALCAAVPDAVVHVEVAIDLGPDSFVPVGRLRAKARERATGDEHEPCELCGARLGSVHDHLLDPEARDLRCACPYCAQLFESRGASRLKRVVPHVECLQGFRLEDPEWSALGIPIDLAFFYRSTHAGRVVAMYPSPAGATESLLSLDAWGRIQRDNPVLDDLQADVEALLVRRASGHREHYRVSIDACFELVGRIRKHWRGLGGGSAVWAQIESFFEDMRQASGSAGDPAARGERAARDRVARA